ncbi:MAG: Wzy polymerase domain-containing protein [Burkholderiaceae bacterium]
MAISFTRFSPPLYIGRSNKGFWLGIGAIFISLAWLLPNHYMPWTAFHADVWIAVMLGVAAAFILMENSKPLAWHWLSLLAAGMAVIPFFQYQFGLLPFSGQAWTTSIYLYGLVLALLVGARWEAERPGELFAYLCLAVGIASIASVALQLYQWFELTDKLGLMSMGFGGTRPYANLGQPNQLGTLLLWGLIACLWGYTHQKIRAPFAIFMACFLLFGVALTQSRTAYLGIALVLVAVWAWRRNWPAKYLPVTATLLVIYFFICTVVVQNSGEALQLTTGPATTVAERLQGESRLAVWRMFADAAMQRPWFGYGWSKLTEAHLEVALNHPDLPRTFSNAHNLFLELILWCGIPIGLSISAILIAWAITCLRRIPNTDTDTLLLIMFLMIIGNHAMLELPLQYAYFLLPTGLVIGAINARLFTPVVLSSRYVAIALWMVTISIFSVMVRDYLRVEENYQALRFEKARIGKLPPQPAPDVVLLTQLRETVRFARFEPETGMDEESLKWVRDVVSFGPGTSTLYKSAVIFALNQRPKEAQEALRKLCKMAQLHECAVVKRVWSYESRKEPLVAAVPWPA